MTDTIHGYMADIQRHSKAEIDKFYANKNGTIVLSAYALSCGYIDIHNIGRYTIQISYTSECYYLRIYFDGKPCFQEPEQYYAMASRQYRTIYSKFYIYRRMFLG